MNPSEEQRRDVTDQAIAAMKQASGRPGNGNRPLGIQGTAGAGVMPMPDTIPDIYHDARAMAKAIDDIGGDAALAARNFQLESQRLAEEYRRLTDAFLVRLIGPRK
jgi:hypothetical protein